MDAARPRSELMTRTISALVLGVAVLFITWWHPTSFTVMCVMGGYILLREGWALTKGRSRLLAFGVALYSIVSICSLIHLRWAEEEFSARGMTDTSIVFFLFAVVWSADIAGYLVGKCIGKHKIWPRISPGKSWEGLAGSIVAASACFFYVGFQPLLAFTYGAIFAIVGLSGDMFESALKRRAGVKDSGRLIPGHGGLFDRVDALMPCAVVMAVLLQLTGLK